MQGRPFFCVSMSLALQRIAGPAREGRSQGEGIPMRKIILTAVALSGLALAGCEANVTNNGASANVSDNAANDIGNGTEDLINGASNIAAGAGDVIQNGAAEVGNVARAVGNDIGAAVDGNQASKPQ